MISTITTSETRTANSRVIMDAIGRYRRSSTNKLFDPLAELTDEVTSLVADSMDADYENHIIRLLIHCTAPQPSDIVTECLRLMPTLTDHQRWIARAYFSCLREWRDGSVGGLDLMVKFGSEYLRVTGANTLPYTTEKDQQLFQLLSSAPHLVDEILERVDHADKITPDLVSELFKTHPALIDGAL